MTRRHAFFPLCALLLFTPLAAHAQAKEEWREWNRPVEPVAIAENVLYVGASDIASYAIVTDAGLILIDGGFAETAPLIEANLAKRGFKMSDVKILLNTHAHSDHAGGLAELKAKSGAKLYAMAADADLLERGGKGDFRFGDEMTFPPVKVDRRLKDGDVVELAGQELTATLTAGHTKGCTTWSFKTGGGLDAVVVCSSSILDYRFVGKQSYPGITADFEKSFERLRKLPCEIFLAPHGGLFDLARKRDEATRRNGMRNPFLDPEGYKKWVDAAEKAFRDEVEKQRKAAAAAGVGCG